MERLRRIEMKIGYCEDEKVQAEWMKEQIYEWAKNHKMEVEVQLFESAEQFLFESQVIDYDLILIDISMSQINGMELARRIREKDLKVVLVFVTSDPSYVFEGYEVNAYRYLIKPIERAKLDEILNDVVQKKMQQSKEYIIIKVAHETVRMECDTILYIEVQGHYVLLHDVSGKVQLIKSSFASIWEKLQTSSKHFFLTHRSYAVNLSKIVQIGKTECTLVNQEKVPVSRSAYKALNNAFIQYNLEETK